MLGFLAALVQYTTLGGGAAYATGSRAAAHKAALASTVGGPPLADGRKWELVSPPNKHGALVEPIGREGVIQAADEGGAITYHADAPIGEEPAGYANQMQVLSVRGSDGWTTEDIGISHPDTTGKSEGIGQDYRFFSADLSHSIVQPTGGFESLSPEPDVASEQTAYLRADFPTGSFRPLVTKTPGFANVPPETMFGEGANAIGEIGPCPSIAVLCGPQFVGATADASHIVISTRANHASLTSTDVPTGGLYEWNAGSLSLASLLPKSEGEAPGGSPNLGASGHYTTRNAISSDGSRVFWIGENVGGEIHLYMRDLALNQTVQLDSGLSGTPEFQFASADGSTAYFRIEQTLYECEIALVAGELECKRQVLAEGILGNLIGATADSSWSYFVANQKLTPEAVEGNCNDGSPEPGTTCNLYVRHDNETKLVAVLSGEDSGDWGQASENVELQAMTARVSPNGEWLAFMSQRSLTGYDNTDAVSGRPDEEVFLYHAEHSPRLVCASCNPTGTPPVGELYGEKSKLVGGETVWAPEISLAANIPGWTPYALNTATYQSRYLSDTGRLFFNSRDALVRQDVNNQWDVYEYEPLGVPATEFGCTNAKASYSATAGGCVSLISSGTSAGESAFLDASATGGRDSKGAEGGGDVFFLTAERLVTQDFDTIDDVYDAHECRAGSPCPPPQPEESAPCASSESCRPNTSTQPEGFGTPPSASIPGTGNILPAPPTPVKPPTAAQLRAKKLAAALKACRKKHTRHKRASCESGARKRYKAVKANKSMTVNRGTK